MDYIRYDTIEIIDLFSFLFNLYSIAYSDPVKDTKVVALINVALMWHLLMAAPHA